MDVTDSPESPLFEVEICQHDRQSVVVVLSGELDLGSAPTLRQCFADLASAGVINVVVDLANLTFVDSTGITILVSDFNRTSASGGSFVVRNARRQAMRVLELTGLVDLLSASPLEE